MQKLPCLCGGRGQASQLPMEQVGTELTLDWCTGLCTVSYPSREFPKDCELPRAPVWLTLVMQVGHITEILLLGEGSKNGGNLCLAWELRKSCLCSLQQRLYREIEEWCPLGLLLP